MCIVKRVGVGVTVKGRVPKWCRCGVDGCKGRETEGVEGRFSDEEGVRVKVEGFLENEGVKEWAGCLQT